MPVVLLLHAPLVWDSYKHPDIRGSLKKEAPVCEGKWVVVLRFVCVMQKKEVGFGRLTDTIDSDKYMAN